jgi:HK97 family phage major capsid protein
MSLHIKEPDMYAANGPHDFLRDLVASVAQFPLPGHMSAAAASERLAKHVAYEGTRIELAEREASTRASQHGIHFDGGTGTSRRALSSMVPAAGGDFSPPEWMVSRWSSVVRACAPLRQLVTNVPLPPNTMTLYLPRFDIVSGVVTSSVENVNSPDVASVTDQVEVGVVTFVGEMLVSQQLFERSSLESISVSDFAESYAAALQAQLVNGTGTNGQILGLLNVSPTAVSAQIPGATLVTYTNGSPTPGAVVEQVASTAAQASEARERPPSAVLMRPGRYFWIAGTSDNNGEPVQRVGTARSPMTPTSDHTGLSPGCRSISTARFQRPSGATATRT